MVFTLTPPDYGKTRRDENRRATTLMLRPGRKEAKDRLVLGREERLYDGNRTRAPGRTRIISMVIGASRASKKWFHLATGGGGAKKHSGKLDIGSKP